MTEPAGRPVPAVVFALVMIGIPTWSLMTGDLGPVLTVLVALLLAAGAGAALLGIARPERSASAPLAVVCATGSFLFVPTSPWVAGLAGAAALGFLLSFRLHAESSSIGLDTHDWMAAHRPMLEGAAVTTSAAVAAVLAPPGWSLPVTGLVGIGVAGLCLALLPPRPEPASD